MDAYSDSFGCGCRRGRFFRSRKPYNHTNSAGRRSTYVRVLSNAAVFTFKLNHFLDMQPPVDRPNPSPILSLLYHQMLCFLYHPPTLQIPDPSTTYRLASIVSTHSPRSLAFVVERMSTVTTLESLSEYIIGPVLSLMNCTIVVRMGISSKPATVYFRHREFLMSSVIKKIGSREAVSYNTARILQSVAYIPSVCGVGWKTQRRTL